MASPRRRVAGAVALAAGLGAAAWAAAPAYVVRRAYPRIQFEMPVAIAAPPGGHPGLFVVEKRGVIRLLTPDPMAPRARTFLSIRGQVHATGHNDERGLLGLAFDPDYARSGAFYVYYSTKPEGKTTRLSRFRAPPGDLDGPVARDSEEVLLEIPQPWRNHNGGGLTFGSDGMLYLGVGDGGAARDPHDAGQRLDTLLGKVLRLDVRGPRAPGRAYGVPADNPFVGRAGVRDEIWAYGFRNPWRLTLDRETGALWTADVGQNAAEEVDRVEAGGNYGWRITEAFRCHMPATGCDREGLVPPLAEYERSVGVSVTGGYVYRGQRLPELRGAYVYGDFATGRLFALVEGEGSSPRGHLAAEGYHVRSLTQFPGGLSSFGEDQNGELLMADYRGGGIYRLVAQLPRAEGRGP